MTPITQAEAVACVSKIAAVLAVPAWTESRIALFAAVLVEEGITRGECEAAVMEYLRTEDRQPGPASIIKLANAARKKRNPYIGTIYEHFPSVWECRKCGKGKVHEGTFEQRGQCLATPAVTASTPRSLARSPEPDASLKSDGGRS